MLAASGNCLSQRTTNGKMAANLYKVFISQRPSGKRAQEKPEIQANSLIYKYFTGKSLFLKDLASIVR
jgi:hypothetical protein